jgi:hypothetical protein
MIAPVPGSGTCRVDADGREASRPAEVSCCNNGTWGARDPCWPLRRRDFIALLAASNAAQSPWYDATCTFTGDEGYVRARVIESNGAMAWAQPVRSPLAELSCSNTRLYGATPHAAAVAAAQPSPRELLVAPGSAGCSWAPRW